MLRKTSPFAVLLLSCFLLQVPSSPGVWQSPSSVSETQHSHTDALKATHVPSASAFLCACACWFLRALDVEDPQASQSSGPAAQPKPFACGGAAGKSPCPEGRLLLCVETVRSRCHSLVSSSDHIPRSYGGPPICF